MAEDLAVGAHEELSVEARKVIQEHATKPNLSLNRPRCGEVPLVAALTGQDFRTFVAISKEKPLPAKDWCGLAQTTLKEHVRLIRLMASHVEVGKNLPDALIGAVERLREQRKWRWSTTLKNAATIQGALAALPLYFEDCPPLLLKEWPPWVKNMSNWAKKTKEEVPTQARPMVREDVDLVIRRFSRSKPHVACAIMLGWLTAARLGCILQLEVKDVIQNASRLAITFRRGKGVLRRGPYTVDTKPLPSSWEVLFTQYVKERVGSRLFPTTLQGSDLCMALRTVNPEYEQRSIRRGSLQTMAANGVDEETLMRFSGHTQVGTLRRYLNWNTINSKVQATMCQAATELIPSELRAVPEAPKAKASPRTKKGGRAKRN